jgi:hypothetical protein
VSRNAPIFQRSERRILAAVAGIFLGTTILSHAADLLSLKAAKPPVRVVAAQSPQATDAFMPREDVVQSLVDKAVLSLTEKSDLASAWLSLVTTQDIVGIKVYSLPGATAGTRPAVAAAVVRGLLAARVPAGNIIIWDKRLGDLRRAGFDDVAEKLGVRLAASQESGYDDKVFYESSLLGNTAWGELESSPADLKAARKSRVTKLVTQRLTKIINVSPLLNNYDAGVAGNLYSLAIGSVDNTARFENSADALARAVPEIYALPSLGDRVVLNISDALICQFEGGEHVRLHNAAALNEIRASRDPVALDILASRDLAAQRKLAGVETGKTNYVELYQNAALLELGVADEKKIQVQPVK